MHTYIHTHICISSIPPPLTGATKLCSGLRFKKRN